MHAYDSGNFEIRESDFFSVANAHDIDLRCAVWGGTKSDTAYLVVYIATPIEGSTVEKKPIKLTEKSHSLFASYPVKQSI